MPTNAEAVTLTRDELEGFCHEFLEHPYLCYTEHGLHSRFASRLYRAMPEGSRYLTVGGYRICRTQKEYPTHMDLDRSKRQHWDVSMIAQADRLPTCVYPLDHMPSATVIEFGLNEPLAHLWDDIERLSHDGSNLHQGFAAHFYRLSENSSRPSARDCSPGAKHVRAAPAIQPLLAGTNIEVILVVVDPTKRNASGVWRITAHTIEPLTKASAEAATVPVMQTADSPQDA